MPTTPEPTTLAHARHRTDERLAGATVAVGALAGATSLLTVVPLALAALAVVLCVVVRRRTQARAARRTALTGALVGCAGAAVNLLLVVLPRLAS